MPALSFATKFGQYGYENIRNFFRKCSNLYRPKLFTNLSEQIYQKEDRIIQLSSQPYLRQNDSFITRYFLRQVSNSYAAQLRRKAASSLMYGGRNVFPVFAFIGISLVSSEQQSTKDKWEGICDLIKVSVRKLPQREKSNLDSLDVQGNTVDDYEFGDVIAKGCNAVVYAAKNASESNDVTLTSFVDPQQSDDKNVNNFKLAIKMMFNYNAESNTQSILRSMNKEILPAQFDDPNKLFIKFGFGTFCKKLLPPHPNIVKMSHAFVDYVPSLPGSMVLYPDALPIRLNADGCGRNMTLFLVMKRYQSNLRQYLQQNKLSCHHALLLFTQLLEGVVHMSKHNVAHRDLKSDNILVYNTVASECPLLVISDFGCCLADPTFGMSLPYFTDEIDKGGNGALMAPEVAKIEPGPRVAINYNKADLWAAGTLAYEIFGGNNPFYGPVETRLNSKTFTLEELPPLHENIPQPIKELIQLVLAPDPKQRPSTEIVATVCHLLLWAPTHWYHFYPTDQEIIEWLVYLTVRVICQKNMEAIYVENQLLSTFLSRIGLKQILAALNVLQNCCHLKS